MRRPIRWLPGLLLAVALLPAAAGAETARTFFVTPLALPAEAPMHDQRPELEAQVVTALARAAPDATVLAMKDLAIRPAFRAQTHLMECAAESCWAGTPGSTGAMDVSTAGMEHAARGRCQGIGDIPLQPHRPATAGRVG